MVKLRKTKTHKKPEESQKQHIIFIFSQFGGHHCVQRPQKPPGAKLQGARRSWESCRGERREGHRGCHSLESVTIRSWQRALRSLVASCDEGLHKRSHPPATSHNFPLQLVSKLQGKERKRSEGRSEEKMKRKEEEGECN